MKKQRAKVKSVRKEPVGFTRKQKNEFFEIVSNVVREPFFKLNQDLHVLRKEMHHEVGSLRTEVGQKIEKLESNIRQVEEKLQQSEEKLKSYIAVQVESLKS